MPNMDLAMVNTGSEVGTKLNSGTATSTARGHQVSTLLAGSAIHTPRPSQVKCLSLKTKRSLGPAQPICLHAAAQMRRWTIFRDNIHEEKLLVNTDVERLTIHSSLWSYLMSGLLFKGKISSLIRNELSRKLQTNKGDKVTPKESSRTPAA